jgi:hypothetical protein
LEKRLRLVLEMLKAVKRGGGTWTHTERNAFDKLIIQSIEAELEVNDYYDQVPF